MIKTPKPQNPEYLMIFIINFYNIKNNQNNKMVFALLAAAGKYNKKIVVYKYI